MEGKSSPRRTSLWAALGLLGLLLLFAGADCGTPQPVEELTDQVHREATQVWAGQPQDAPPLLDHGDWQPLNTGDAVTTDGWGEAQLTLVDCVGSLWVFNNSGLGVCECTKSAEYNVGCLCWGDEAFDGECAARLTLGTQSCIINAAGTAFTVSYLPELQLSAVTVLTGTVVVTPVLDIDTSELAKESILVREGQFVFTQPGPEPTQIAGLDARRALPLNQLPILVKELNLEPRFEDITTWGLERKILPPIWPFMPNVGLWDQGGPLDQVGVQDALLSAIDFKQVLAPDLVATEQTAFTVTPLDQRAVDAYSLQYDPEKAKQQLAEAYPDGFGVLVAYPESDRLLAAMAGRIADQLTAVGLDAKPVSVPADQMEGFLKETLSPDAVTFWLLRR